MSERPIIFSAPMIRAILAGRKTMTRRLATSPLRNRARAEFGCHDGVLMDDDTYGEGWQTDVVYPPCPYNPAACVTCQGSGDAPPMMAEAFEQDDCVDCHGTGWKDGKCQWPIAAPDDDEPASLPPRAAGAG